MTSAGYRVGVPKTGDKWRCPICTLMNSMEKESCARCQEPASEEQRQKLCEKAKKGPSAGCTGPAAPCVGRSALPSKAQRHSKGMECPPKPAGGRTCGNKPKSTKPKRPSMGMDCSPAVPRRDPSKSRSRGSMSTSSSKPNSRRQAKRTGALSPLKRTSSGFGSSAGMKKKPSSSSSSNSRSSGPSIRKKNFTDMNEKQLGYKASKKASTRTFANSGSRLHRDTAAYRGKFEQKALGGKKGNIATVGDLKSKSGWQTSIQMKNNPWQKHQEKACRPPAKYSGGRLGGTNKGDQTLISRLQQACSGDAVASLHHKGRFLDKYHKEMDGQKTKFAL